MTESKNGLACSVAPRGEWVKLLVALLQKLTLIFSQAKTQKWKILIKTWKNRKTPNFEIKNRNKLFRSQNSSIGLLFIVHHMGVMCI